MLAEAMAGVMADTAAATPLAVTGMRWQVLRADTLALFAVGVANVLSAMRVETHALQDADFALVAAAGDAGGEVVIGIRTPDIPGSAITAGVGVIHITELTVIPPVGIIIILTSTDTGLTGA